MHKYVFRHEQQKTVVSNKGLALIDLLDDITTLCARPSDRRLGVQTQAMETGELSREVFMNEIKSLTETIVNATKDKMTELANRSYPDVETVCPSRSATTLKQTDGNYECTSADCKFKLNKYIASHKLQPEEVQALGNGASSFEDFKNWFGQPFVAELKMAEACGGWKPEFVFEGDEERETEADNLTDDQLLCEAPLKTVHWPGL